MKTCAYCGGEFTPKNKQQKYDKPECMRLADRDRKRQRKASGAGKYTFVCKGCGITYHTDYKNRDQYHSRECAYAHRDQWWTAPAREPSATIVCHACGKSVLRVEAVSQRYCSDACWRVARSGTCEKCGKEYSDRHPTAKYCAECSCEISLERAKERSKEKYEPVPPTKQTCVLCGDTFKSKRGVKYCKACAKKRGQGSNYQRAKLFGVKRKRFSERRILNRDNWTCYICGVHTPEELRGTYEDNAPEIDHVIPLSKGGPHVPSNVRCCCRKCNMAKSDKTLKEVRHAAAVPLFAEVGS